jgi:hypothetical protein
VYRCRCDKTDTYTAWLALIHRAQIADLHDSVLHHWISAAVMATSVNSPSLASSVNDPEKGPSVESQHAAQPAHNRQHQDASEEAEEQFAGSVELNIKETVSHGININDWNSLDDPDNPFNWPKWKRWYHSAAPALLGFAV